MLISILTFLLKTPKSPRVPSSEVKPTTPKVSTPQAPAVVPETPKQPRSILKQNDFGQKKRRVVFAGSDEPHSSSEDDDEKVLNNTKVIAYTLKCFGWYHVHFCFYFQRNLKP